MTTRPDAALLFAIQADQQGKFIAAARSEGSHADLLFATGEGCQFAWFWLGGGMRDGDLLMRLRAICESLGFDSVSFYLPRDDRPGWENAAHFVHWPAEGALMIGPESVRA